MPLPDSVIEPPAPIVVPAQPAAPAPAQPAAPAPAQPAAPAALTADPAAVLKAAADAPSLDAAIEAALNVSKTPVHPPQPAAPKPADPAPAAPTAELDDAAFEKAVSEEAKQFPDEKARGGFKKLRYDLRQAQRDLKQVDALKSEAARAKELEARLAEASKTPAAAPTAPELEALRKERDALKKQMDDAEGELAHVRLEGTTAFKERIGKPLADAEAALVKFTKDFEIPEADLTAAMTKPGRERVKALSDLVADVPAFAQNQFFGLVDTLRNLREQRVSILENARANYDALRQQETEREMQTRAEFEREWKAAVADRWSEDIVKHAPFLVEHAESPDWNARLKGARSFAESVPFEQLDTPSRAAVMHRAATFPLLVGAYQSLQKLATAQAQRIAELGSATPAAGPGTAAPAPKADTNGVPEGLNFQQAVEWRLKHAGMG